MKRILELALLCSSVSVAGAAGIEAYNMPDQVAGIKMAASEVMAKMERAVSPDIWRAYRESHPAPFWLFGEDRRLSVRNDIIPAHWFSGRSVPTYFRGKAQPGEFYPFQICVASEKARELEWGVEGKGPCETLLITPEKCSVRARGLKALWLMLKVPTSARKGDSLSGNVYVKDGRTGERLSLPFHIDVDGAVLQDGGIHDSWRLSRLIWLVAPIGDGKEPTRGYTPLKVDRERRTVSLLGRTVELGEDGLPAQYLSTFNASNTRTDAAPQKFLSRPMEFTVKGGGVTAPGKWIADSFAFLSESPVELSWRALSHCGPLARSVEGRIGFDGFVSIKVGLKSPGGVRDISGAALSIVVPEARAPLGMGLGKRGGRIPRSLEWSWNVKNQQDAFWFGSVNQGMMIRLKGENFSRALINAYYDFKPLQIPESWGNGGVTLSHKDGYSTLTAYSKERKVGAKPLVYGFDLYLTPFHPLNLKAHLADRYFHYSQRKQVPDFRSKRDSGATVINLHHNTLWNPYINYPYNDHGGPLLKQAIKMGHDLGLRMKVYYTTRELTQNLPEFFALKSLDGEVFMPRKEGVKWPVTNRNGPNPWLQKHVGMNIIPAWHENVRFPAYPHCLDLAVLTSPDTRWNNFYLGGLEYLVKEYGIDGLYIDDTMLNRDAMMRARRILDADGNPGRRIDIHSWSHFNNLAGRGNSAIIFMELFPFVDRAWYGEGFSYNSHPDFWLVEMSGLPFGVMGEMLGGWTNPYRGMVFGETGRWGWGADPRNLWAFFDSVSLGDSEFIGFWDPANPVKFADPDTPLRATVYRQKGRSIIAVANFSNQPVSASWSFDGKAKVFRRPAIPRFQEEGRVKLSDPLTLEKGSGCLLIAE